METKVFQIFEIKLIGLLAYWCSHLATQYPVAKDGASNAPFAAVSPPSTCKLNNEFKTLIPLLTHDHHPWTLESVPSRHFLSHSLSSTKEID